MRCNRRKIEIISHPATQTFDKLQQETLYIYLNSKLLAPIVYFAKPVKIGLWAIWEEQHARYTLFLSQHSQEGNECTTL